MAHVGAKLDLPMAANVTEILGGEPLRLVRQRWAGSLLEESTLDAPTRLLTIAPHAVAVEGRRRRRRAGRRHVRAAARRTPTSPSAVVAPARAGSRRASPSPMRESSSAAAAASAAPRGSRSSRSWPACWARAVGVSRVVTSQGWRPHSMQIGQTGMRIAPDLYIACGISGAIQHIVGARAAKRILAINTDAEAPIMAVADYAVIGDLHQVVPAISAEVRRVTGR